MTNHQPPVRQARTHFQVPITMRDGVTLRADIIIPETDQPVPVVLMRSPYPLAVARFHFDQFRAVAAGFAVVSQSLRGTGSSEGSFVPWSSDAEDGADTIAWCTAQPWSSGEVVTVGASYLAHTQLYAAQSGPPGLKAMATAMVPSQPYDLIYNGGALALSSSLGWALGRLSDELMRRAAQGLDVDPLLGRLADELSDFDGLCRTAPLTAVPLLGEFFPDWNAWLEHPAQDEWWQARQLTARAAVPTLVRAGWWDVFLTGTLSEWAREPRHSGSALTVGPWSHLIEADAHGDIDYGPSASAMMQDIDGRTLQHFARHLASGSQAAQPPQAPVRLFVMGENRWRDEPAWPLARARDTRFFLHPGGLLSAQAPTADAEPVTFRFDPRDPVPTLGGRNLLPGSAGAHRTGPVEQSRLDHRTDILHFVSPPLSTEVEVTGPLTVTLNAMTSAADTDWTAKLVDVWPDGRAYNVADGIVRARFSRGTDRARLVQAGTPHQADIDLAATAQVFRAGHRIRVDISSSNFPRFDRNPGTGDSGADICESEFVVAEQTVFLDSARPSFITLPLIDR